MVQLNELSDNQGARHTRIRVGRGVGSGKGKTCGRGVKGQKSRTGVAIKGFEGGQMPVFRRLPKRGFTNAVHRTHYETFNLADMQRVVDAGRLDVGQPVTKAVLKEVGLIRSADSLVKLLGQGEISAAVTLQVDKATAGAVAALEKAGGSIQTEAA